MRSVRFKPHGVYRKYYYSERINIFRVRCECCGRTQSVIPSFSLPDTSIGTKEAEEYLLGRNEGKTRRQAGLSFLEKGFGIGYLKSLEKLLRKSILNAKAIFTKSGDLHAQGLKWIFSVIGETKRPVYEMNMYCLNKGFNAVFCSRFSILIFKKRRAGTCISHNKHPLKDSAEGLDSS
jgi:hypothetical protein